MLIEEKGLTVSVQHLASVSHSSDMLLAYIESNGQAFIYVSDIFNAGLGLTIAIDGPEQLFAALRELGYINSNCEAELPTSFIPTHGVVQSLEESIVALNGLGHTINCWICHH